MYYLCSENKGADHAKLICAFGFANADCLFSHGAAHISQRCIKVALDLEILKLVSQVAKYVMVISETSVIISNNCHK